MFVNVLSVHRIEELFYSKAVTTETNISVLGVSLKSKKCIDSSEVTF
jgi:hypothetical protein